MTLVSSDGFSFVCSREAACVSPMIEIALRSGMAEEENCVVKFADISGAVLEICVSYFHAVLRAREAGEALDFPLTGNDSLLLELLAASNFLNC